MYIKILSKETDTGPERSISILGVDEVEFFECKLSSEEYRSFCDGATQNWVTRKEEDPGENRAVGCLSITKENGKNMFILFDWVAFLCNKQGKAVERYLVS